MYKTMDIAQYIINHSIDIGHPVSNLKLQKLLYYIQAAFLVERHEPCFEDSIEHWDYGPVVPEIYRKYKKYIDSDIKEPQKSYKRIEIDDDSNLIEKTIEYSENNIEQHDRDLIDKVLCGLSEYQPWFLVRKTHEETPWKETGDNKIIDNDKIYNYFSKDENINRIYGEF